MNSSIAHLVQAIPPTTTPRPKDWQQVESQVGASLPKDYKQLVDAYGGGSFDDSIWLLEPWCANRYYDLVTENKERPEILERLWTMGEPKPPELAEEGVRVIPWALTENGMYLYWLVRPEQDPEDWTVILNEGRGPGWERHSVPCGQFLEGVLLTGDVESSYFEDLPADTHEFRPSPVFA
nr:SMI1/KNR4 family protein [Streptomyces sp. NBC_00857]